MPAKKLASVGYLSEDKLQGRASSFSHRGQKVKSFFCPYFVAFWSTKVRRLT